MKQFSIVVEFVDHTKHRFEHYGNLESVMDTILDYAKMSGTVTDRIWLIQIQRH